MHASRTNIHLFPFLTLSEACQQQWKSVCDPNCKPVNLAVDTPFTKECNPALVVNGTDLEEIRYRCNNICNSLNLLACGRDCTVRCFGYCQIPNHTIGEPVPLFCFWIYGFVQCPMSQKVFLGVSVPSLQKRIYGK